MSLLCAGITNVCGSSVLIFTRKLLGGRDDSASKGDLHNPQPGRREVTPTGCPVTAQVYHGFSTPTLHNQTNQQRSK